MAQTQLRANMFGNTPSDRDSFAEALPESPESVNVAVLIGNLRNELEDKYQKQIEELKSKVDKLMGGAPNPNLNAVNSPAVKFEKSFACVLSIFFRSLACVMNNFHSKLLR